MTFALRIASLAAAFALSAGAVASADTVELTLTVPLTIKVPLTVKPGSPGSDAFRPQTGGAPPNTLKPFDVSCAVGKSDLAYSTATGAAQNAIGQGSTATSGGSVNVYGPDGSRVGSPSATVILTYDVPVVGATGVAAGTPSNYLCWITWKQAVNGVPPFFVQGQLAAK